MKNFKQPNRRPNRKLLTCALASCLMLGVAPSVFAQSTGATVRGQVSADSAPASDATVTATNLATGLTRSVKASASGGYSLAGLPPGPYRIVVVSAGQTNSQEVTLAVGQTATLNLGVGGVAPTATGEATDLGAVTVIAPPSVLESKTSEIATYVSQKQINALPQSSRNFLAFADIVPGVQFTTGTEGSTALRSGAQLSNGINVFIDGVGQKDYVLKGGITGQDSSRGNPFPQLGIAEYKVITSNYKAEYDQLSSAGITAVTKSGTNEFQGSFFWDYTSSDWTAKTVREENGETTQPKSKTEQYGVAFGGPLIRDVLHFFVTYEAKEYENPRTITPGRQFLAADLPARFQEEARASFAAPFKEDLYFGKLSWAPGDAHLVELTMKRREEDELTGVGGVNVRSYGILKTGEETRVDLRYQYNAENWLNDAHITYEDANFAPRSATFGTGYKLFVPRREQVNLNNPAMEEVLNLGAGGEYQEKGQNGYAFQNDFTFFGWEGHTIKAGVKYKAIDINAFEQSPYNPQFRYDINRDLDIPYFVQFTASGNGFPTSITSDAKQLGLYLQDDWAVNDHLTLNLGLRWDYETNPVYENHVTPATLVNALENYPNINNPGVDYDWRDYVSTGNNRSSFKDGWQPRLGFSYDINGDERHVFFGGAGRSYNRNQFDYLSFEQYRLAFQRYEFQFNTAGHTCVVDNVFCYNFDPSMLNADVLEGMVEPGTNFGTEVFLLNNDLKTPYSDQFSLGMRNSFPMLGHDWNSSVTVQHVRSHDGILFTLGNRNLDGSYFPPGLEFGNDNIVGRNPLPGYRQFFRGDNAVETKVTSLLISLDKPYTNESGWGVSVAYTYSDAKENRNNSDIFSFDYPDLDNVSFTPALKIAKHRLVTTGIVDLWGFTASAKLTLATPEAKEAQNCFDTTAPGNCFFDPFFADGTLGYKQFDVALQKQFDTGTSLKYRVRADVLNVFNWRNYTDYETWRGFNHVPNANFGNRNGNGILLPTREFKLSFGLDW